MSTGFTKDDIHVYKQNNYSPLGQTCMRTETEHYRLAQLTPEQS